MNKTKLHSLPLYAVFGFLFYEADALQHICDVVNPPLLSHSQLVCRLQPTPATDLVTTYTDTVIVIIQITVSRSINSITVVCNQHQQLT